MTKLIEIKDKILQFYGKYETYLFPIVKFFLALFLFLIINQNIGFMRSVSSMPVAFGLALICSLLPVNFTLLFAAIIILFDMYALAVEALAVTAILFLVIYLLYFRFAPSEGLAAVITPIAARLGIFPVMPVGTGLLCKPQGILAVIFSTMIYYYLDGIRQNEAAFLAEITKEDTEVSSKFAMAISQITENRELILVLGVTLAVGLIVYAIRRSQADHAWTIAIITGLLIEISALLAGNLLMDISEKTTVILIGGVISLVIALVVEFFCMNLDYGRTERVQFEDDEYYYYVKAVPKKLVASEEKVVKHFGNTSNIGRRIQRPSHEETPEEEELGRRVISHGIEGAADRKE